MSSIYNDSNKAWVTDKPIRDCLSESFKSAWKEDISFYPEVCNLPLEEREKWKSFAKRIYNKLQKDIHIEDDEYDDDDEYIHP